MLNVNNSAKTLLSTDNVVLEPWRPGDKWVVYISPYYWKRMGVVDQTAMLKVYRVYLVTEDGPTPAPDATPPSSN